MIMTKRKHQELLDKVEASINSIRPYLQTDGGNIEVLEITDEMTVKLRLLGNCEGCPMSEMTMTAGVEETIKRAVPEILKVESV